MVSYLAHHLCQSHTRVIPSASTMKEKPSVGDVVEVTWVDAFRYKGEKPAVMEVKSWGKVEEIISDGRAHSGIAIAQNEVQTDLSAQEIQRVMDGQFIPQNVITNVEVLKKHELDDKR